jgi:hypothetical protein
MKRLVLALCLLALPVHSTTRYVSKNGSDSYTGASWEQAWLTLTNVNDISRFYGGDTVIFGAGRWRETIMAVPGTAGDRTCFADSGVLAGGSRVAWIFGADSLSTWTVDSASIYSVHYTVTNNYQSLWQGSQLLYRVASKALINAEGKWYYDGAGHILARAYGSGDPDLYDMEFAVRTGARLDGVFARYGTLPDGSSYETFLGLGFKYGCGSIIGNASPYYNRVSSYNYISHCYLDLGAGEAGNNPSLIYMGTTETTAFTGNRVTACSLGTIYAFNQYLYPAQVEANTHGNCLTWYSSDGGVIDSNIVFGHQSECAFYLKYNYAANPNVNTNTADTIRFNTIAPTDACPYGIRIYGGAKGIEIYGNVISNVSNGVQIGYSSSGGGDQGSVFVRNNTFYNCARMVGQWDVEGRGYTWALRNNEAKYNIGYRSTASTATMSLDSLTFWSVVDSNMYYAATGSSGWQGPGTTSNTWSQWQARGVDLRSINGTNPGFTDADNGNFARPGAGTNMNATYGGRTWMQYGAIQNSATSLPTGGISGAVLISGDVRYWIR